MERSSIVSETGQIAKLDGAEWLSYSIRQQYLTRPYKYITAGGKMRITLDRQSVIYKAIYRQRTAAERINSQAKALGIERPQVRNSASVHNLNTLTYVVINARALTRLRAVNACATLPGPALC